MLRNLILSAVLALTSATALFAYDPSRSFNGTPLDNGEGEAQYSDERYAYGRWSEFLNSRNFPARTVAITGIDGRTCSLLEVAWVELFDEALRQTNGTPMSAFPGTDAGEQQMYDEINQSWLNGDEHVRRNIEHGQKAKALWIAGCFL